MLYVCLNFTCLRQPYVNLFRVHQPVTVRGPSSPDSRHRRGPTLAGDQIRHLHCQAQFALLSLTSVSADRLLFLLVLQSRPSLFQPADLHLLDSHRCCLRQANRAECASLTDTRLSNHSSSVSND